MLKLKNKQYKYSELRDLVLKHLESLKYGEIKFFADNNNLNYRSLLSFISAGKDNPTIMPELVAKIATTFGYHIELKKDIFYTVNSTTTTTKNKSNGEIKPKRSSSSGNRKVKARS